MSSEQNVEQGEKRTRMSNFEFVTLWNSDRPLTEIAEEKGVNLQSLKVRAITLKKKIEDEKKRLQELLTEEQGREHPNQDTVNQIQLHVAQLSGLKLRDRKATRKLGLESLLALASEVRLKSE